MAANNSNSKPSASKMLAWSQSKNCPIAPMATRKSPNVKNFVTLVII